LEVPATDAPIPADPTEVNVELVPDPPALPPSPPYPLPAFDFPTVPAPATRHRRPHRKGSPLAGLFIALLVLVALGVGIGGWFLWVSVKNERDKQRLVDIEVEIDIGLKRYIKEIVLDAMVSGLHQFAQRVKEAKSHAEFDRMFQIQSSDDFFWMSRVQSAAETAVEDAISKRAIQPDALDLSKRLESLEWEYDEIRARHPEWQTNASRLTKRVVGAVKDFETQMMAIRHKIDRQRKHSSYQIKSAEVEAWIKALISEL